MSITFPLKYSHPLFSSNFGKSTFALFSPSFPILFSEERKNPHKRGKMTKARRNRLKAKEVLRQNQHKARKASEARKIANIELTKQQELAAQMRRQEEAAKLKELGITRAEFKRRKREEHRTHLENIEHNPRFIETYLQVPAGRLNIEEVIERSKLVSLKRYPLEWDDWRATSILEDCIKLFGHLTFSQLWAVVSQTKKIQSKTKLRQLLRWLKEQNRITVHPQTEKLQPHSDAIFYNIPNRETHFIYAYNWIPHNTKTLKWRKTPPTFKHYRDHPDYIPNLWQLPRITAEIRLQHKLNPEDHMEEK